VKSKNGERNEASWFQGGSKKNRSQARGKHEKGWSDISCIDPKGKPSSKEKKSPPQAG
jgi:hypothetical protein